MDSTIVSLSGIIVAYVIGMIPTMGDLDFIMFRYSRGFARKTSNTV